MDFIAFLIAVSVIAASVLTHEAGHAAFLSRYGVSVVKVQLGLGPTLLKIGKLEFGCFPIGGAVSPDPTKFLALTGRQKFMVAIAGPFASALLTILLVLASESLEGGQARLLYILAELNLFIAFFNLLPIPPLDGFQALSALKEHMGKPLTDFQRLRFQKFGNAVIYGLAFYVLSRLVFNPILN